MFSLFLTTNIYPLIVAFLQLFSLNFKTLIVAIYNVVILSLFIAGIDKLLLFEISAIFGLFFLFTYNKHLIKPFLLFISTISLGLFILATSDIATDFLTNIVVYFNISDTKNAVYIIDIFSVIAVLLIIGFIPFTEWNMYLFSISQSIIKISSFILPMFFSLFVLQEMAKSIPPIIFAILGAVICIYSCIGIFTIHKISAVLSHIITYFYGLQVLFLYNKPSLSLLNNWISIVFVILWISDIFFTTRTSRIKDRDIKSIFLSSFNKIAISVICFVIILLNFTYSCLALKIKDYDFIKITTLCCFICCIIKIIFYSLFYNGKIPVLNAKQDKKTTNRIYGKIFQISKNIIYFIFIVYLYSISFIGNKKQGLQDIISSSTQLVKPSFTFFVILFLFIILSIIILFFTSNITQPKIMKSSTYSKIFFAIFNALKIIIGIIKAICEDFSFEMKNYFIQIFNSTLPKKMSYILYNNNVYFYIFFLIQAIIVLTIECAISS